MNKFNTMLQTAALSLLLIAGAQAGTANKATVVAAGASASASHAKATHAKASSKPMMKVDINSADASAIDQALLNVGPSKAQAIVAYRKQHGAFKSADQLAEVKGIGLKTVDKNRDRIVVGTLAKR